MLQHEDERVISLLAYMKSIGFCFDVLGGYPRDLHFGRLPRDMDVCVYDLRSRTVLFPDRIQKLHDYLHIHDLYKDEFNADGDYPSDRIWGGIRTKVGVDIIFWLDEFTTCESVLRAFDFNINQFRLLDDYRGNPIGMPCDLLQNYGKLVQLRDSEVTDARLNKFKQLAIYVGWKPMSDFGGQS